MFKFTVSPFPSLNKEIHTVYLFLSEHHYLLHDIGVEVEARVRVRIIIGWIDG